MKLPGLMLLILTTSLGHAQWQTDLNRALRQSEKPVLLFFTTGRDCERCHSLEENVLKSKEFLDYAQQQFTLVKQDFDNNDPEHLEENLLIVEKYNKDGFFPLVVLIAPDGKRMGQIGAYQDETPAQYIAKLKTLNKA